MAIEQIENPPVLGLIQGSSLKQSIAITGSKTLLSKNVEFLRFTENSTKDCKKFCYKVNPSINSLLNYKDKDTFNIKVSIIGIWKEFITKVFSKPVHLTN